MPQPPHILFIGEAVSLAHVGRPLTLARWAREAGHEVHFACGRKYAEMVRAEGFEPLLVPTIGAESFHQRVAADRFFYSELELDEYVRAELRLFEELQPDLVVGDFRLSLGVSSAIAGVPLLSLLNAYWSPARECRFAPPSAGFFGVFPPALRNLFVCLVRPLVFRFFGAPLRRLRRRYGLPPLSDFRELLAAEQWCAYPDLPELFPIKTLPAGHFFLGPLAWQPRGLPSPDLGALGQHRPLAYVSLGSSGDKSALPKVLAALRALDCDLVVSGVSATEAAALRRELPGRCVAEPLLAPREILGRSAVTICHGGSGTIYQSLAAGVPLLCLPANRDQKLASAAVEAQGAGLVLDPKTRVKRLQGALAALLHEERLKRRARALAAHLRRHDAHRHWLDWLTRVLPTSPASVPSEKNAYLARSAKGKAQSRQAERLFRQKSWKICRRPCCLSPV